MPRAVKLPYIRKQVLANHPKVKHLNGELIFPDDWADEVIRKIVAELDASEKVVSDIRLKAFTPSDADKQAVGQIMRKGGGKEYDLAKFGFFEIVASQTVVDLAGEITTKALLDELAPQYKSADGAPGKSLLINHGINQFAGATYDASVRPMPNMTDSWELAIKVYIPDFMMFQGNNVLDMVNTGVISKASAGFRPGDVDFRDAGGKTVVVLDTDKTGTRKSTAIELSLAYQGAVEGARVKTASDISIRNFNSSNMSTPKSTKTVDIGEGASKKTFSIEVTGGDAPAVNVDALVTHANELQKEVDRLKKAESDSKKPLVDKIISLQKKLKMPEDNESHLLALDYNALDTRVKYLETADKGKNPKNQIPAEGSGKKNEGDNEPEERKKTASFWDDDEEGQE